MQAELNQQLLWQYVDYHKNIQLIVPSFSKKSNNTKKKPTQNQGYSVTLIMEVFKWTYYIKAPTVLFKSLGSLSLLNLFFIIIINV